MVKKSFSILLKALCLLAFIIIMLTSGTIKTYVYNSSAFYYSLFVLAPLLLIPVFPKNKLNSYAVVVAALMMLEGATQFMDRIRGSGQFHFQVGNTVGPLRILLQHESAQGMIYDVIFRLPQSIQERALYEEGSIRVLKIYEIVGNDYLEFQKAATALKTAPLDPVNKMKMYELGTLILSKNKLSSIETKITLYELSQDLELTAQETPEQILSEIDQQMLSGQLSKSEAVAYKLKLHQLKHSQF